MLCSSARVRADNAAFTPLPVPSNPRPANLSSASTYYAMSYHESLGGGVQRGDTVLQVGRTRPPALASAQFIAGTGKRPFAPATNAWASCSRAALAR